MEKNYLCRWIIILKLVLLASSSSMMWAHNLPAGLTVSSSLAFQVVSYDCTSGLFQYQFTGGDGSPISVTMPGIFGGTMNANTVASTTFPSDARTAGTVTGTATQSGNTISINFAKSCNTTTPTSTTTTPTNPTSSGSLAFQVVSYNCTSGVLQYQFTGGNGSPINVSIPGVFGGTMNANTVASTTFPGDARTGGTMTGNATQSGNTISINFTKSCNTTTNPPTGNCPYSEGQFLFTTSWGESVYAHFYNNTLFAAYQDGNGFKPQHWLVATGQMSSSTASCFAENDPHTTTTPTQNPNPNPNQTTSPAQAGANFAGNLDGADCSGIGGWVVNKNKPHQSTKFDVYINGWLVGVGIPATNSRQDVANALGISGYNAFGFYIPMPAQYKTGSAMTISVKYTGTQTDIPGSPKTTAACPVNPLGCNGDGAGRVAYAEHSFRRSSATIRQGR